MSIRKKINIGFLCLGFLLLFSGSVSFIELRNLNKRTETILETSSRNVKISRKMLDAAQQQNSILLQMIVTGTTEQAPAFAVTRREFDDALTEAGGIAKGPAELDAIVSARDTYFDLVDDYFDERHTTDVAWFVEIYRNTYNNLTQSVKDYMTSSQEALINRAMQLENNAYRAMMPGILTLVVALAILVIFLFFIDTYYTRPVIKIEKGLQNYLKHNVPFKVTVEGRDEVAKLKEYIETLIATLKSKKTE